MSYPDRDINLSTDARANKQAPAIEFAVKGAADLARLRDVWSQMPSIPKLLANRLQGEDNSWPGFEVRTLVRGEESSGRWAIHSIILAPGAEFWPHAFDGGAYFLVMDGEVSVTIGAQSAALRRGASAFAPAQTTQAFANRSSQPTGFFIAHTPAGSDRAFAAVHALSRSRPGSAPSDYRRVLSQHGFAFTDGAPQPNDGRVNAHVPRVDAEIETANDYQLLRERWSKLPPTPRIVRNREECYNIPVPDQETRVLVRPEESSAQASMFAGVLQPGFGAPPHHQPTEEEIFFVQDGAVRLIIGSQTAMASRGAFGFAPRYCTHAFKNEAQENALVVTINSPGGHDRGFELATKGLTMERLLPRMPAHGFEFHPPA